MVPLMHFVIIIALDFFSSEIRHVLKIRYVLNMLFGCIEAIYRHRATLLSCQRWFGVAHVGKGIRLARERDHIVRLEGVLSGWLLLGWYAKCLWSVSGSLAFTPLTRRFDDV